MQTYTIQDISGPSLIPYGPHQGKLAYVVTMYMPTDPVTPPQDVHTITSAVIASILTTMGFSQKNLLVITGYEPFQQPVGLLITALYQHIGWFPVVVNTKAITGVGVLSSEGTLHQEVLNVVCTPMIATVGVCGDTVRGLLALTEATYPDPAVSWVFTLDQVSSYIDTILIRDFLKNWGIAAQNVWLKAPGTDLIWLQDICLRYGFNMSVNNIIKG